MKTRNVILAAAVVASGTWLAACAGQPNAGCPVSTSNPAAGLPPYWVKYTKVSATGSCGDLPGEGIGFQKYNTPGTKEIRLAYRPEGLGHPYGDEGRFDPTDPEGRGINGFAKLPSVPGEDLFCTASDFTAVDGGPGGPSQTFEEIPAVPLADGGMEPAIPALFRKYEFTNLKFLATVNAPGTVFTGEIKLTEDTCTATFKAVGLWPQIGCDPSLNGPNGYSLECDPVPNADAGHILGSGINPTFNPKGKPITCGTSGFCELQLTVDEIAKL